MEPILVNQEKKVTYQRVTGLSQRREREKHRSVEIIKKREFEASLDCLTQFINWFVRQLFITQSRERAVEKEKEKRKLSLERERQQC